MTSFAVASPSLGFLRILFKATDGDSGLFGGPIELGRQNISFFDSVIARSSNAWHCAGRLWKHLQDNDAVPTEIDNALQKNWVKHLVVDVRTVGSPFPQRHPDSVPWPRRVPRINGQKIARSSD